MQEDEYWSRREGEREFIRQSLGPAVFCGYIQVLYITEKIIFYNYIVLKPSLERLLWR